MQVELIAHEGAPETYTVRLSEEDKYGKNVVVGRATRATSDEWEFRPQDPSGRISERPMMSLQAKTVDELRDVLSTRFGTIEISADRLRGKTMDEFTDSVMTALLILAQGTESKHGFLAAISGVLAQMIVDDITPSGQDGFVDLFMKTLKDDLEHRRKTESMREAMSDLLDSLAERLGVDEGDGDKGTQKH
jgi:hypothetical protein